MNGRAGLRASDPCRDLAPGAESETVEDLLDVPLDRALGKEDSLGDLFVAQPERDELSDLLTPRGQLDSSLHCRAILTLFRR